MLERLPHSRATKDRISKALKGRARPPEVREAIADSLRGRKQSEATKAKRAKARAKAPTAQQITRARHAAEARERIAQWKRDQYKALRAKNMPLFEDVKASNGWCSQRNIFNPIVSDGYGPPRKPRKRRLEDIRLELYFQAQEYAYGIPRNR